MALVTSTSSLGGLAGSNALARLLVVISGDATPLQTALGTAGKSMQGFRDNASTIGNTLIRSVTLPILGLGGAAIYMASQFQSAMGRVAGLTPILQTTDETVETISNDLLALSQIVPTAPAELADALYYAGSAGLAFDDAMQVVEFAAKGAAIGMGEAADISKVLVFALNNYGAPAGGPLTAARAMDALTAAIREGTAEPAEMAIALGRLLPVAKEAGITFEEVVGSVAALTNLGMPARVATTSLRALFAQLLGPTRQGEEAMNALNLSAEQVLETMRTTGPIGVFKLLEDAVQGDERALRDILPQIRAFTAYLGLTNNEMKTSSRIMEATTNSAGDLERAFKIISQTPQFKFDIALNKMRVAAIRLGSKAMPIFLGLVAAIGHIGDSLANLPDWAQTALVAFAALAAAAGPLIKLWAALGATGGRMFSTFGQITTGLATMGLAAYAAFAGFDMLRKGTINLATVALTAVGTFTAVSLAIKALESAAIAGAFGAGALSNGIVALGGAAGWVGAALAVLAVGIGYMASQAGKANREVNELGDALLEGAKSGQTIKQALDNIKTTDVKNDIIELAKSLQLLNQPITTEGLDELQSAIGGDLVTGLEQLQEMLSTPQGEWLFTGQDKLADFTDLVRQAVLEGRDLAPVLGKDREQFEALIHAFAAGGATGLPENFHDIAVGVEEAMRRYPELIQVQKDWESTQLAAIAATTASEGALSKYANELGVSTEYLSGRMQEFGISAVGMTDDVKASFEAAAFGVDENGDAISADVAELQSMVAAASKDINESIIGAFDPFAKVPKDLKKTSGELLKLLEDQADMVLEMSANINILAERGVTPAALQMLADQGPQYVAAFVDASKAELNRLNEAVALTMGATTESILAETLEFQNAGHQVMAAFTEAMLGSASLSTSAATRIIQNVSAALGRGDMSPAGVNAAIQFSKGLGTVKNLTEKEAAAAMNFFIREVQRRNLNNVGRGEAQELARGLASEAGISKNAARKLVQDVVDTARSEGERQIPGAARRIVNEFGNTITQGSQADKGTELVNEVNNGLLTGIVLAGSTGSQTAWSYANGLGNTAAKQAAYDNAYAVAQAGKRGFEDGSKGSPRYFTYYLGLDLVKDLNEGLKNGTLDAFRRPVFDFPIGGRQGRLTDGGAPRETKIDLDLDVKIERSKVAREIEYHYAGRGR